MDPLSTATAVITIAGAATTTYKEISGFIDTIKSAPKEVEDIRLNAGNVYNIISNLRSALEQRNIKDVLSIDLLAQKDVQGLQAPLNRTKATLEEIATKLHEHFRPSGDGKEYKLRFQWWKAKKDFQKLLAQLRQDKETLSLSMVGLNTFQTLRTLGEQVNVHLRAKHVASNNDPATSLRMYAQSVLGGAFTALDSQSQNKINPNLEVADHGIRTSAIRPPPSQATISLTLEAKRELAQQKKEYQNDLLEAAKSGDVMDTEILLAEGTEIDWIGCEGKTALHLAAQHGHKRVVQILLDHGADIEAHCEPYGTPTMIWYRGGNTPLHFAAGGDDTGGRQEAVVRLLLDRGADVNARSLRSRTPLQAAVTYTRTGNDPAATICLLLDRGAHVNAFNTEGWTPLHEAAHYGTDDLAQILLNHGAHIEGRPTESDPAYPSNPILLPGHYLRAPLLLACSDWSEPLMRILIKHKTHLDAQSETGDTLLHLAAVEGRRTIVPMLLEAGANPDIREYDYGSTALHNAAYNGSPAVVRAILRAYGNTQILNNLGQTPIEIARLYGHWEVAAIITKYDKIVAATLSHKLKDKLNL